MKKLLIFLVLALAVLFNFQAFSESKYCEDGALVLSNELEKGLEDFSSRLKDKKQLEFYINTIHFSGTKDKAELAKKFLSDKGEAASVLLLIVGEDDYYFYSKGEAKNAFKQSIVDASSAKSLRQSFIERQYDKAVLSFLRELCSNTIGDEHFKAISAFKNHENEKSSKSEKNYKESRLDEAIESLANSIKPKRDNEKGTNIKGLVVWFFIIYFFVIRRRVRVKRGCGCLPFI